MLIGRSNGRLLRMDYNTSDFNRLSRFVIYDEETCEEITRFYLDNNAMCNLRYLFCDEGKE